MTTQIEQDLSLLDFVSQSLQASPQAIHERALHVAQVHDIAEPASIAQALSATFASSITPPSDPPSPYAWDRPGSLAQLAARKDARDQECQNLKDALILPGPPFAPDSIETGVSMGIMFGILAFGLTVLIAFLTGNLASQVASTCALIAGVSSIVAGLVWGGVRNCKLEKLKADNHPRLRALYAAAGDEEKISPCSAQIERWKGFPEVVNQAKLWLNSDLGLMAKDIELLDAQAERFQAQIIKSKLAEDLDSLRHSRS